MFDGNRQLLDRFRRGERDALELVYSRYVSEVGAMLRAGFPSGTDHRIRRYATHAPCRGWWSMHR